MATESTTPEINLPKLPVKHDDFLSYIAGREDQPLRGLLEPYNQYDAEMRKVFAQNPSHPAAATSSVVPVFNGHESNVKVRARNINNESKEETERYIMPLNDEQRRPDGSPAIVESLQNFRTNFNIFSESSLADLDWSNVVAAGSAVVTSLLAVPKKYAVSKRKLREYYHDQLAPASDVDLFLYGLTEEQAVEKIKQIERNIRDAILAETTTIRTKNAITIASEHPTRHVQIVLRIYKSISEILTGFDVDCSCAAFDGKQVYASPRALIAYMSQINTIDLTRRSPSYENRLSKYAHRGFEVYWPLLNRSRIDPTIFERSFGRIEGLARLLVLERLPKSTDRDDYLDQRRRERGRPEINRWRMRSRLLRGNIKNDHEDEVAEWVDSDEVSDYHTFTIPYGPKFTAKRIEKLLYTKDLLLNAEWNRPKDREVNLHRHPAFFGRVGDVIHDCCGYCPKPSTIEEEEVAEEEGKIYVSGDIDFIKDDPGRQSIGSFNPLSADDWTDMAYVGNTARLCQAIVDGDEEYVRTWLKQEGNDPNTRDYTGRTPLHLAVTSSTPEIVQILIDEGSRIVARLFDGKTALHLAAMRGNVDMVSALLRKSEANEEEEEEKLDARRKARAGSDGEEDRPGSPSDESEDIEMIDAEDSDEDLMDTTTERSMVRIKTPAEESDKALAGEEDDEPDVYDVNVLAWDSAVSPLHLAIIKGHCDVVRCLVQDFGADVLQPIKLFNDYDKSARAAILTMVLALQLPTDQAQAMTKTLVELGATSAQADFNEITVLDYTIATRPDMVENMLEIDKIGVGRAINHLSIAGYNWSPNIITPLLTAIRAKDSSTALLLLAKGANAHIKESTYVTACDESSNQHTTRRHHGNKSDYFKQVEQPIIVAVQQQLPDLVMALVQEHGEDVNTLTCAGQGVVYDHYRRSHTQGTSLLDETQSVLKELKKWKPAKSDTHSPLALKSDSEYLSEFAPGSYSHWSARRQVKSAKEQYAQDLKRYEEQVEQSRDTRGVTEKQTAINEMIEKYKHLESLLKEKGAKKFADLHPDIAKEYQPYRNDNRWSGYKQQPPTPFEVGFSFQGVSHLDEVVNRYTRLFEAAWGGDLKMIKELTLQPWKNGDGDDQAPLKVAVQDQHQMSPFSIAILHSNFELATAIMQIAQAQYVPPEPSEQNEWYKLDTEDDDSVDSDSDDLRIYKEIIDDQFTVETIGEVSTLVKSRTKPVQMLMYNCPPAWDFVRERVPSSSSSEPGSPRKQLRRTPEPFEQINLIKYALRNDDIDLLGYLITLGEEYIKAEAQDDDEDARRFFSIDESTFMEALRTDRPHLTAELIKRTGAGIPFKILVEKSGVEVVEKPRYYQGLSVYGKKRQDWATAGRTNAGFDPVESYRPPILESAHRGALETVEWLLSDAPMRCYKHFAWANQDYKQIKRLSEATGGFEASISRFFNVRTKLAIHCCIMGRPGPRTMELLRFLIKNMSDTVNAKSREGITPLHIAFRNCRYEAARALIEAGADQTCRDREGNNILHHLLKLISKDEELPLVQKMFELVDKRLIESLCTERSSCSPGAITPLAQWVANHSTPDELKDQVLRLILGYSKGAELSILNGEGNIPLHVCVRDCDWPSAQTILEHDPTLLLRENATGRTSYEMGEHSAIAVMVKDPPPLPRDHNFAGTRAKRFGLPHDWQNGITARNPEGFQQGLVHDGQTEREKLWDLLRETNEQLQERSQATRRLVTLNEANEVAKRLAQRGAIVPEEQEEDVNDDKDDDSDEVKLWLGQSGIVLDGEK